MEQNLRPERPARATLLLLKTIFEMFKLCVRGSLSRTRSYPGLAATEVWGEEAPGATLRQAWVSAFLCAPRTNRGPSRVAGNARPGGRPGAPGPPEAALGCLWCLLIRFLPTSPVLSPARTSARLFSAVTLDFWSRGRWVSRATRRTREKGRGSWLSRRGGVEARDALGPG